MVTDRFEKETSIQSTIKPVVNFSSFPSLESFDLGSKAVQRLELCINEDRKKLQDKFSAFDTRNRKGDPCRLEE